MAQDANVAFSSQRRASRDSRDVNATSSSQKQISRDDADTSSGNRRRNRRGSRSEGNRDKTPAASRNSGTKCEILFRNEAIQKDMNLHVRSSSTRTLVYRIHRKDISPTEFVAHLNKVIGPITDVSSTPTETGYRIEVFAPDDALYTALRDTPVNFKGTSLKAVVPTPVGMIIRKVNFRGAPPDWRLEDFLDVFGGYGEILEISRYFVQVNKNKVFVGQGFIFFRHGFQGYPSIPETINLGNGCSILVTVHDASKPPKVTKDAPKVTKDAPKVSKDAPKVSKDASKVSKNADQPTNAADQSAKAASQPTIAASQPTREMGQPTREMGQPTRDMGQPVQTVRRSTRAADYPVKEADQSRHPIDITRARRRGNRKRGPKYDDAEAIDPKEEGSEPTSPMKQVPLPWQQQQQQEQQQQQQKQQQKEQQQQKEHQQQQKEQQKEQQQQQQPQQQPQQQQRQTPWLEQDLLPGRYPLSQSGPFFSLYALLPLFMIVFQLFHRD